MRRLTGDRGAVAVLVALLIVPLLVCTALVVDIGSLYVERRQLQNAADAGALAIAQDCAAARAAACSAMVATATSLATQNSGSSAAAVPVRTGSTVTVTATATVSYVFAPVVGIDSGSVSAKSTASWGAPVSGTSLLPIAFSWCAFKAQTGGGVPTTSTANIIYTSKTDETPCTGPSGNSVPGGFGWLKTVGAGCTAKTDTSALRVDSDPGRSKPSGCTELDFERLQDKTVLLPVYDDADGTGNGAWFHIYAYAAFRITGYNFGGQYSWPQKAPCKGDDRCIAGYFTVFVEPSDAFTYGATAVDLGARLVRLTA